MAWMEFTPEDHIKRFGTLSVAILDEDSKSAQLTRSLLSTLGVYQLRMIRDAAELKDQLSDAPADVVVADVSNKAATELEAIYQLRRENSNIAFTPVIALSPQITASDLRRLLDVGTNEIVAKPANAKSMFSRLQSVIDMPRSFVVTKDFKGPDRRRKTNATAAGEVRQTISPNIVDKYQFTSGDMGDKPSIIMPDFSLKLKVANALSAGHTKSHIEQEFLFWALSDVATLEATFSKLSGGLENPIPLIERLCTACLSIKARASIYNYQLGAKVAGLLSDFCRNYYQQNQPQHSLVIRKHIQVLSTIFNQRLSGNGGGLGQELLHDLSLLVKKYVQNNS